MAERRCSSQADAEDLAAETMLAALACLEKGETIEHPRTWLARTLAHKHADLLRRQYRAPVIVNLECMAETLPDESPDRPDPDEEAAVRRELNYLARQTREVMLRHYYAGQSVAEIAQALGIPAGSVKRRLSEGRQEIKKGLTQMEQKQHHIPGHLNLSFTGRTGANFRPNSLVDGDRIAQNLLAVAYEKPLTVSEIAVLLGIPTVYLEPIVDRLVEGELMVRMPSGKVYTDFILFPPDNTPDCVDTAEAFAARHLDTIVTTVGNALGEVDSLAFVPTLTESQRQKLHRYVWLRILQDFQHKAGIKPITRNPARRDGGAWTAEAWYYPRGYVKPPCPHEIQYEIRGGHRTSTVEEVFGLSGLTLYEFDTTYYDSPNRFSSCFEQYWSNMQGLLWCIYSGLDPAEQGIHSRLIEEIPWYVRCGMLARNEAGLHVDIPVLSREAYTALCAILERGRDALVDTLGEAYRTYLRGTAIALPRHLTSVPDWLRYQPAVNALLPAILRRAVTMGAHMQGIDYLCPAVLLVYDA